jgi:hypothetical protein
VAAIVLALLSLGALVESAFVLASVSLSGEDSVFASPEWTAVRGITFADGVSALVLRAAGNGNEKSNLEPEEVAGRSPRYQERAVRRPPLIDVAIEREHWELAAYCMLVGVVEGLNTPDAVEAFPDELALEMPEHRVAARVRARSSMVPTVDDRDRKGQDEAETTKGPLTRRNFYARKAVSEAEAIELDEAAEIEGLADEIALLRVRLRAAANNDDADLALICKGAEMLVKAVGMQYRLSPKATKDLAQRFAAVLNSVGDQILPRPNRRSRRCRAHTAIREHRGCVKQSARGDGARGAPSCCSSQRLRSRPPP